MKSARAGSQTRPVVTHHELFASQLVYRPFHTDGTIGARLIEWVSQTARVAGARRWGSFTHPTTADLIRYETTTNRSPCICYTIVSPFRTGVIFLGSALVNSLKRSRLHRHHVIENTIYIS
jgi:hypothetical protein